MSGKILPHLFTVWAILTILGTTLPWTSFHPTPLWWRVNLAPFVPGSIYAGILQDMTRNVLLYLPFGFLFPGPLRARFLSTFGAALLLSSATECAQIFNAQRFPAAMDILMNVTGALVGRALRIHMAEAVEGDASRSPARRAEGYRKVDAATCVDAPLTGWPATWSQGTRRGRTC